MNKAIYGLKITSRFTARWTTASSSLPRTKMATKETSLLTISLSKVLAVSLTEEKTTPTATTVRKYLSNTPQICSWNCSLLALTTGCADKSREAFFNNKNVAGCRGDWDGLKSLRDRSTGKCGNKFPDGRSITCKSPADVCDTEKGWRVCGASGDPTKIRKLVSCFLVE